MMSLASINPVSGELIAEYPVMTDTELSKALTGAATAFAAWRKTSFSDRRRILEAVARQLENERDVLGRLITQEMGKPITEARAEIDKCAWACRYYANEGEGLLKPQRVSTEKSRSYISFAPLGLILAIMPWNFPFWQVFRSAAPTLMAGNGFLLKHAPNVTGCALSIEKLWQEAGLPLHVFQTLRIELNQVPPLITDPRVMAVTITGSTHAGRTVAAQAGAALKKCVLELGGSDPYVILADADIARAAELCVQTRLFNTGQSCIAAKRFIVLSEVLAEFQERVLNLMRQKHYGDPLQETTELGPLARPDLRVTLHRQVAESITKGAHCLLGGTIPTGPGNFYPATLLTNIRSKQAAYREELFGPVAVLISARDEQEALRIANDTAYGLGAAIFSRRVDYAEDLAVAELNAGSCAVNGPVHSDPRLPFGGIKQSGYGRELGAFGIHEFTNIKTILVA